jgi:S-adenosylmethionine:diacylglycerol 3-amino-3-carboxypropyl transferase
MTLSDKFNSTPWRAGRFAGSPGRPKLLFRRMFEDWQVESIAFRQCQRVLCIASGGCTAIALAGQGHTVTAVDINAAQIAHVRGRLAGAVGSVSSAERVVRTRRWMLRCLGASRGLLDAFLTSPSPEGQLALWDRIWTRRAALAARVAFHPAVLRRAYDAPFVRALPARFDDVLIRRFRRGLAIHANLDNPFVWQMLAGERPVRLEPVIRPGMHLRLVHADVVDFLLSEPPASFDAISLSNIFDGCDAPYRQAAIGAVLRSAAPGAIIVLRTFGESAAPELDWRWLDRSHLWGGVSVERVSHGSTRQYGRIGVPLLPPGEGLAHVGAA